MDSTESLKKQVLKRIESLEGRIKEVSSTIHSYAELGTKEVKSSALLRAELAKEGFKVEKGVGGVPTAFRAIMRGRPGPSVALLAEYDALPEIGHACGHNIIGTSATFAAISLSPIRKQLRGTVIVLGTPDEEGFGGKIPMLQNGAFRGVDVVIENHPFVRNAPWWPSVALGDLMVQLAGREAHYATPQKGANALDAALAILSALNILRHGFRPDVLIGYTLNTDSKTPVIVPAKATLHITLKATDIRYLKFVVDKIKTCIAGISKSAGVQAQITDAFDTCLCYEESVPNLTLIDTVTKNLTELGVNVETPAESTRFRSFYSTDYGNVSRKFPGVNFAVAIAPVGGSLHTPEFARAAVSRKGHEALIIATKVMAMTIIDLMHEPDTLRQAKNEFRRYQSDDFKHLPLQPIFD
jgi:amidohydrolase